MGGILGGNHGITVFQGSRGLEENLAVFVVSLGYDIALGRLFGGAEGLPEDLYRGDGAHGLMGFALIGLERIETGGVDHIAVGRFSEKGCFRFVIRGFLTGNGRYKSCCQQEQGESDEFFHASIENNWLLDAKLLLFLFWNSFFFQKMLSIMVNMLSKCVIFVINVGINVFLRE